jgi:hypothetical protein
MDGKIARRIAEVEMSVRAGAVFKPGESCPRSGIYLVIHDPEHVERHEVTVVDGEPFPSCTRCGSNPRFTLLRPAVHLRTHRAFKK